MPYQVVQAWLETFLAMAGEAYQRPLPRHVVENFEKYVLPKLWGFDARGLLAQAPTTDVVEARLDLQEAFEFPTGGLRGWRSFARYGCLSLTLPPGR